MVVIYNALNTTLVKLQGVKAQDLLNINIQKQDNLRIADVINRNVPLPVNTCF